MEYFWKCSFSRIGVKNWRCFMSDFLQMKKYFWQNHKGDGGKIHIFHDREINWEALIFSCERGLLVAVRGRKLTPVGGWYLSGRRNPSRHNGSWLNIYDYCNSGSPVTIFLLMTTLGKLWPCRYTSFEKWRTVWNHALNFQWRITNRQNLHF